MNYFKNKFAGKKKQPTPRTMQEINKDFNVLCGTAGMLKHRINLAEKDLQEVLFKLEGVNAEANARQALDRKEQEENAKKANLLPTAPAQEAK